MALATMDEIVGPARAAGHGVCAFNVIGIEHAEAIAAGAEAAAVPVVLQISENCAAYHGALEPIARACLAVARSAAVPVGVHLDHAASAELVEAAQHAVAPRRQMLLWQRMLPAQVAGEGLEEAADAAPAWRERLCPEAL